MNTEPVPEKQWPTNLFRGIIALSTDALIWFLLYKLLTFGVPTVNHDIVIVIVTSLVNKRSTITDWAFGGSAQRTQSDRTISTQADTLKAATMPDKVTVTVPASHVEIKGNDEQGNGT